MRIAEIEKNQESLRHPRRNLPSPGKIKHVGSKDLAVREGQCQKQASRSSQWSSVTGLEVMCINMNTEVPPKHEKELDFEGARALE